MSSFDWRARNYSEFWGKKLSEGVQLRLGTLNPSNSVSEYNIIIRFLRSFERACFQTDRKQRFTEWIRCGGYTIRNPCLENSTPGPVGGGRFRASTIKAGAAHLGRFLQHKSPRTDLPWWARAATASSSALNICSRATRKGNEVATAATWTELGCSCENSGNISNLGQFFHLNDNNRWSSIFFFLCHSLVDEKCYPWKGMHDQCKLQKRTNLEAAGCRAPANPLRKELYKVGPAYRLGNETDIMREILTSGPVQGEYLVFIVYLLFMLFDMKFMVTFQPPWKFTKTFSLTNREYTSTRRLPSFMNLVIIRLGLLDGERIYLGIMACRSNIG